MGARVTRQSIMRNITAATEAGLSVVGIAPNGTVLTSDAGAVPELVIPTVKPVTNSCDEILSRLTESD